MTVVLDKFGILEERGRKPFQIQISFALHFCSSRACYFMIKLNQNLEYREGNRIHFSFAFARHMQGDLRIKSEKVERR